METTAIYGFLAWILGAAGLVGSWIYGSIIERKWLDVREVRLSLPRLPHPFSGFRLVLISDIHLGFYFGTRELTKVVAVINSLAADVVCFTGDFLDTRAFPGALNAVAPVLTGLKAPFGKFAVLGNHDYRAGARQVIRELSRGGFHLLLNEHVVLEKGNEHLYVIGLEDILVGKPSLAGAMAGIPVGTCRILLVHEPDYADETEKYDIDLQLSGHSHGGQVCLPLVGPLASSTLGKKYRTGLYRVGNLALYTNQGLGTTVLPVRFLCRPEITLIILE